MNKAVVMFLKQEPLVHQLIESGVFIRDVFVQVSPLSAPSTRITVSGVPPFIQNELLEKELRKFRKFASGLKTESSQGFIRVQAPQFSKVSMAVQLTGELQAADVLTRFLSQDSSVAVKPEELCLYEIGGNINDGVAHGREPGDEAALLWWWHKVICDGGGDVELKLGEPDVFYPAPLLAKIL